VLYEALAGMRHQLATASFYSEIDQALLMLLANQGRFKEAEVCIRRFAIFRPSSNPLPLHPFPRSGTEWASVNRVRYTKSHERIFLTGTKN